MYRAPIYKHAISSSDFVVIRDESGFWIREIDGLYVCGQQLPFVQVHKPDSKLSINICKNLLQVIFIFYNRRTSLVFRFMLKYRNL